MPSRMLGATLQRLNQLLGTSFTSAPGITGSGALVAAVAPTFTGQPIVSGTSLRFGGQTVSGLGTASGAGAGSINLATDLTSLTNGSTATGGGGLKGIVKSDGTNWIVLG